MATVLLVALLLGVPLAYTAYLFVEDTARRDLAEVFELHAAGHTRVIAEARKLHPYSNPAFVVLPVDGGSEDFLRWIMEQTAKPA